jgi:hypothetical protein
MTSRGVLFVAYGIPAINELRLALASLRKHHKWDTLVVGECEIDNEDVIVWPDTGAPGRDAKTSLYSLSPYDQTLFLDADTRVNGDLSVGFGLLADGWELVMIPSRPQGDYLLSHLGQPEHDYTMQVLYNRQPLQLNTGVMWFAKTPAIEALFKGWRAEWGRFKDKDQGAFLRALEYCPVKLWLLGFPFNSDTGAVVSHYFGRASKGCCR